MSWVEWLALLVALLVMLTGVAGSFLPGLPGPPVVLAVALVHKLIFGTQSVGWTVLAGMTGLMLLSIGLEYAASLLGARKLGATWRGVVGAAIGGFVGLFFGLPGLVLGPFVGAVLLEMAAGRPANEAGMAGLGALLGLLAGTLGKVACTLAMIGLWLVGLFWPA